MSLLSYLQLLAFPPEDGSKTFIRKARKRLSDYTVPRPRRHQYSHHSRILRTLVMCPFKESFIISGTGTAIWSRTNFGPTGYHLPWSSPLDSKQQDVKNQHISSAARNCVHLTPKVCYYHHVPLHRVTTTDVQIAAPVPEIMDTHL
jgi:hypothetical protein